MRLRFVIPLSVLFLAGCYPDPYGHDNPNDPNGTGTPAVADADGDGYTTDVDCDDDNAAVHPDATEVPYDGIDQDCSGGDLNDVDGDGYVGDAANGDDCDDQNGDIHPGETEVCDGVDNDCTGVVDDNPSDANTYYPDEDGDSYGDKDGAPFDACAPPDAYADNNDDCDDQNEAVYPGVPEICDGIDNNCNDRADEGLETAYYLDADGDGFGDPDSEVQACEPPSEFHVLVAGDCNDSAAIANPDAEEVCEDIDRTALDNDCDGTIDEGVGTDFYLDGDGDTYGDPDRVESACSAPDGYVAENSDCDDTQSTVNPGAQEVCDDGTPLDNDCDTAIDEGIDNVVYLDADLDSFGDTEQPVFACTATDGYSAVGGDCDDANGDVNPGALEVCDVTPIDNDCDDAVDEGVGEVFYPDLDFDAFGNTDEAILACIGPDGYVSLDGDCDDNRDDVYPGAPEKCSDVLDSDCDGSDDPADIDGASQCDDADGDGYCESEGCPDGLLPNDCDDANIEINPEGIETLNGVDDNCDDAIDNEIPTAEGDLFKVSSALAPNSVGFGERLSSIMIGESDWAILSPVAYSDSGLGIDGEAQLIVMRDDFNEGVITPSRGIVATSGAGLDQMGAIGDFNGDGFQDIVQSAPGLAQVCLFLGAEAGFALELNFPEDADLCIDLGEDDLGQGLYGRVALVDLDADSMDDLILALPNYSSALDDEREGEQGALAVFLGHDHFEADAEAALALTLDERSVLLLGAQGQQIGENILKVSGDSVSDSDRLVISYINTGFAELPTALMVLKADVEQFAAAGEGDINLELGVTSGLSSLSSDTYSLEAVDVIGGGLGDSIAKLMVKGASFSTSEIEPLDVLFMTDFEGALPFESGDLLLNLEEATMTLPEGLEATFGASVSFSGLGDSVDIIALGAPFAPLMDGDDQPNGVVYSFSAEDLIGGEAQGADSLYSYSHLGPNLGDELGTSMTSVDFEKDGARRVLVGVPGAFEGQGALLLLPSQD